jgi:hypothetical protein
MSSQGPYGRQGFQSNPGGYGDGSNTNTAGGGYGGGSYATPQYGGAGSYGSSAGGMNANNSTPAAPSSGGYGGADYSPYGAQIPNDYGGGIVGGGGVRHKFIFCCVLDF